MQRDEIEAALTQAEQALDQGETALGPTGYWQAVAAVKRDPELAAAFAGRIAAVDQKSFLRWAMFTLPFAAGTLIMLLATLAGFVLVLTAYSLDQPWNGWFLLVGTGITLVTTHGLAHLVVGRALGIRFTGWFIGSPTRPQPGVKVEYRSYLVADPKHRAWMHASGAILTKLIPFFALGPALVMETPWWTTALLIVIGVAQIVTDIVWSTKSSDWKKYRREMRYASSG